MPKIRDLGINVIPETMRPPEIGPGGGCNAGTYGPACPTTTFPTTPYTPHFHCPKTTFTMPSLTCYPTGTVTCPNTTFPTVTGPQYAAVPGCPGTTFPTTGAPAYMQDPGCPNTTFPQQSEACYQPQQGLTRDAVQQLKQQLQQQIAQLDEYAKNIGPRTRAEIEAREAQLQAELEELARRKKELKD